MLRTSKKLRRFKNELREQVEQLLREECDDERIAQVLDEMVLEVTQEPRFTITDVADVEINAATGDGTGTVTLRCRVPVPITDMDAPCSTDCALPGEFWEGREEKGLSGTTVDGVEMDVCIVQETCCFEAEIETAEEY